MHSLCSGHAHSVSRRHKEEGPNDLIFYSYDGDLQSCAEKSLIMCALICTAALVFPGPQSPQPMVLCNDPLQYSGLHAVRPAPALAQHSFLLHRRQTLRQSLTLHCLHPSLWYLPVVSSPSRCAGAGQVPLTGCCCHLSKRSAAIEYKLEGLQDRQLPRFSLHG